MTRTCVETFPCCKKDENMCVTVTFEMPVPMTATVCLREMAPVLRIPARESDVPVTMIVKRMSTATNPTSVVWKGVDRTKKMPVLPDNSAIQLIDSVKEILDAKKTMTVDPDAIVVKSEEIRSAYSEIVATTAIVIRGNAVVLMPNEPDMRRRLQYRRSPGCPDDQVCHPDGACRPACRNNDDCDGNELVCNRDSGFCVMGCRDDGDEPNNTVNDATAIMLSDEVALDGSPNVQPGSPTVRLGKVEIERFVRAIPTSTRSQCPPVDAFVLMLKYGKMTETIRRSNYSNLTSPVRPVRVMMMQMRPVTLMQTGPIGGICQDRVCIVEAATVRDAQAAGQPMGFTRRLPRRWYRCTGRGNLLRDGQWNG